MSCSVCGNAEDRIVLCGCKTRFCPGCFSIHECKGAENAQWHGGQQALFATSQTVRESVPNRGFNLRPYQAEAFKAICREMRGACSTLVVLPTGCGKTVLFGEAARVAKKRVLVIAHRDELIRQAADKVGRAVGLPCSIEMGDIRSNPASKVVVSSVQTMSRPNRMLKFDPSEFSLMVIDEAHHATARTYRKVIKYFRDGWAEKSITGNQELRILGVTATPDRGDEEALGSVFGSVAYEYGIQDAIEHGWLAPIRQKFVSIEGLDFSKIGTVAGDLNQAELAAVMEAEAPLHEIVDSTRQIAAGRQTLIFAVRVAHAERMAEILNRHLDGCAKVVHGGIDKDTRREIISDYAARKFQFLCNCDVAIEGFDEPEVQVVAIAKPTKSRARYAQMVGRGTRALPGVVDGPETPEARIAAIGASRKPFCTILDFVGNAGRHKLITTADILGGNYSDEVIELAEAETKAAAAKGEEVDMSEQLKESKKEVERLEAEKKKRIIAKASFTTVEINPFQVLDIVPNREPGWHKGRLPTEKQLAALRKFKVEEKHLETMSFSQASQLLDGLVNRSKEGLASYAQTKLLAKNGVDASGMTFQEASAAIEVISKSWKRRKVAR